MWHGILVDAAFDARFLNSMKIVGRKKSGGWTLLKIEVGDKDVSKAAKRIQDSMKGGFYSHLYSKDGRLIIIFKNKIFRAKADKKTWAAATAYGKLLGIPAGQLDFWPCTFEDEDY